MAFGRANIGGGLKINGVEKSYPVDIGHVINKGDFVNILNGANAIQSHNQLTYHDCNEGFAVGWISEKRALLLWARANDGFLMGKIIEVLSNGTYGGVTSDVMLYDRMVSNFSVSNTNNNQGCVCFCSDGYGYCLPIEFNGNTILKGVAVKYSGSNAMLDKRFSVEYLSQNKYLVLYVEQGIYNTVGVILNNVAIGLMPNIGSIQIITQRYGGNSTTDGCHMVKTGLGQFLLFDIEKNVAGAYAGNVNAIGIVLNGDIINKGSVCYCERYKVIDRNFDAICYKDGWVAWAGLVYTDVTVDAYKLNVGLIYQNGVNVYLQGKVFIYQGHASDVCVYNCDTNRIVVSYCNTSSIGVLNYVDLSIYETDIVQNKKYMSASAQQYTLRAGKLSNGKYICNIYRLNNNLKLFNNAYEMTNIVQKSYSNDKIKGIASQSGKANETIKVATL